MKKIVVLGESIAGVAAVEEIRRFEPQSEAVILACDGHYPYDRSLFTSLIAKEIDYKKIFYRPNDYYEKNRITVITGRKISRINLKKCRITTEDKAQLDYDVLIIADAPGYKLPEIKGANKSGVYGLRRLSEIDTILDMIPLTDTVVIQADDAAGMQIAAAFLKREKEVIWIVATEQISRDLLAAESGEEVRKALAEGKLRVIAQNPIAEILGEADAKAVRLKSGKVLAAQMIILPEAKADWKLLEESSLQIRAKICVNDQFRTAVDGVFAVDAVCELSEPAADAADSFSVAALERQGGVVASALKAPRMADSSAG